VVLGLELRVSLARQVLYHLKKKVFEKVNKIDKTFNLSDKEKKKIELKSEMKAGMLPPLEKKKSLGQKDKCGEIQMTKTDSRLDTESKQTYGK
jgi:hypothetical protein